MPNLIKIHLTILDWRHSNRLTQIKVRHFAANTIGHIWGALGGGWGGCSPAQAHPRPLEYIFKNYSFCWPDDVKRFTCFALQWNWATAVSQSAGQSVGWCRPEVYIGRVQNETEVRQLCMKLRRTKQIRPCGLNWTSEWRRVQLCDVCCAGLCWSAVATVFVTLRFVTLLTLRYSYTDDSFMTIFN